MKEPSQMPTKMHYLQQMHNSLKSPLVLRRDDKHGNLIGIYGHWLYTKLNKLLLYTGKDDDILMGNWTQTIEWWASMQESHT